jgi:hypothetical protein
MKFLPFLSACHVSHRNILHTKVSVTKTRDQKLSALVKTFCFGLKKAEINCVSRGIVSTFQWLNNCICTTIML